MGKTKKRVTIMSIANHLGLSVATVSYVLNDKVTENGIPEKTAKRVKDAAQELGYVPNDLARSLRRQKTSSIGIVLSDLQQGWADRTMKGVLSVIDPEGYVAYMSVHFWDPTREKREIESMVKRRMEAIITVPMVENAELYNKLSDQGIQLIFLQDELEDCPEISFCMWDAKNAAKECVKHLIETGRKKIGFSGVDHMTPWLKMRLEGYREALREAGMTVNEDWICLDHRESIPTTGEDNTHFGSAIMKLYESTEDRPDAFLAMNDAVAMTTLSVIRDRYNQSIPEDVAIIGMGDLAFGPLTGLSSAHEPVEEVGQEAARIALNLIKSKGGEQHRGLVKSDDIVIRGSTSPPSVSY